MRLRKSDGAAPPAHLSSVSCHRSLSVCGPLAPYTASGRGSPSDRWSPFLGFALSSF